VASVSVANLKPGMKLSRAVVNDSGMVLLPQGTVLTDSLIQRIENMNLTSISVEGGAESRKPKEEVLAELEHRFRKSDDQPLMQVIKRAMREHLEAVYNK